MKSIICLSVGFFLTVGVAQAVTVDVDCSKVECDVTLTCQKNVCKSKVGSVCGPNSGCVANAQCIGGICVCAQPYQNIANGEQCALPVHVQCTQRSDMECVKNAQCVRVTNSGTSRLLCQCKRGYTYDVGHRACNTGYGLVPSFLMVAAIFVTSRLL
ncbi:hypothetical protein ACOMHN_000351 [Nucella lapillus]